MKRLVLFALLASAAVGTRANAQVLTLINPTTLNGSFETPVATGGKSNTGFDTAGDDLANWTNTGYDSTGAAGATYNDIGFQSGGAEDGTQFAFFHAGQGGAFNLTTYTIQAGDQFNLTWYGDNNSQVTATLFGTTTGTFAPTGTLTQASITETGNAYVQYGLNYTATAADAGNTIGVSYVGVTGYPNVDNVVLTVTSAVPEPSSYVLLAVSSLGVIMAFRRQRA